MIMAVRQKELRRSHAALLLLDKAQRSSQPAPEREAGDVRELPGLMRLRDQCLGAALCRCRCLPVGWEHCHVDFLRCSLEGCNGAGVSFSSTQRRNGSHAAKPGGSYGAAMLSLPS